PADDRRPPILLSHDEARRSGSGRVRPGDAVWQRLERAPHADGDLGSSRAALRGWTTGACVRTARRWVVRVAPVLRRARCSLHADRSIAPAAVRAAPRPSGLLIDRDVILPSPWDRSGRGVEPALRARRS